MIVRWVKVSRSLKVTPKRFEFVRFFKVLVLAACPFTECIGIEFKDIREELFKFLIISKFDFFL